MNLNERLPALTYFLKCYFHQDFEVLFGNTDGAITAYKMTETMAEKLQLRSEIEDLVALSIADEELQNILLNKIDCSYFYPNEWNSSEEWLRHIYEQVS